MSEMPSFPSIESSQRHFLIMVIFPATKIRHSEMITFVSYFGIVKHYVFRLQFRFKAMYN